MKLNTVHARTLAISAIALAAGLTLTGCAAPTPTPDAAASSTATPNAADQMFVLGMIPHHDQALVMSDIMLDKEGVDDRVVALAERIRAAQQPEIDRINGWLTDWGVDASDNPHAAHEMGGMLSDADLDALEAAPGAEASRLFLTQMIEHHLGAVEMAQQVLDAGQDSEVRALADAIVADQSAEIAEMEALLAEL